MKPRFLVHAAAALFAASGLLACESRTPVQPRESTGPYEQVERDLADERAILLDARELNEWDSGHLAGAIIFPLSWLREFEPGKRPNTLPAEKTIYVYGGSAEVAREAADLLVGMGFDASAFEQGLDELATSFVLVRNER